MLLRVRILWSIDLEDHLIDRGCRFGIEIPFRLFVQPCNDALPELIKVLVRSVIRDGIHAGWTWLQAPREKGQALENAQTAAKGVFL